MIWRDVFLGVIAVATVAIAIAQVGVIIAAGLMARRVGRMIDQLERDVKPLFGHLNAIGSDASRAVALATAQVERVDKLFTEVTARIEQTINTVQASIDGQASQGRAMLSAFRAVLDVVREMRGRRSRQSRGDDEDALFI